MALGMREATIKAGLQILGICWSINTHKMEISKLQANGSQIHLKK